MRALARSLTSRASRRERNGSARLPGWVLASAAVVAGASAALFYSARDEAPFTRRERTILVSSRQLGAIGAQELSGIKRQYARDILPQDHASVQTVRRVGLRIAQAYLPASECAKWTFTVIRSEQMNAFVLPGGHVCVFSGLFKVTPNEDALAAVLAHEAAHVIANHAGEQMSRALGYVIALQFFAALGMPLFAGGDALRQLVLEKPHSRELESEADEIGLHLLARSCAYDPREMPKVFSRLEKADNDSGHPFGSLLSEYLSTHPSHPHRITQQEALLPEVLKERAACCS